MSNQTAWGCVFLFSYNSFWVGSQSVRIQTPPSPPSCCPGYLVTGGALMTSAAWWDQESFTLFRYTRSIRGLAVPSAPLSPWVELPSSCRKRGWLRKVLTQAATQARECSWGSPGPFLTAEQKPAESKGYESSLDQGRASQQQPRDHRPLWGGHSPCSASWGAAPRGQDCSSASQLQSEHEELCVGPGTGREQEWEMEPQAGAEGG